MNTYGQFTLSNTLNICKTLNSFEDVHNVVDAVAERFLSVSKGKDRPVRKYTKEAIDSAIANQKVIRERQTKAEIVSNKKLFQRSAELIENYLGYQKDNISNYEKFCLEMFLAGLSSHLNKNEDSIKHYKLALEILEDTAIRAEKWGDLSFESYVAAEGHRRFYNSKAGCLFNKLQNKINKHVAMSQGPVASIEKQSIVTLEGALLSKSFINSIQFSVKIVYECFNNLRSTEFSTWIMKINALNALEHERYNILFVDSGKEVGGSINIRNTIRISPSRVDKTSEAILHELTHKALDDVFHNSGPFNACPYVEDDLEAQDAYRESIRQVLLNYVDALIPIDELAKLNCGIDYNIDLKVQESYKVFTNQKVNFVHPWSRDMSLDQLVENCFKTNGLFYNSDSFKYFSEGGYLKLNEQTVCKGDKNRLGGQSVDYVCKLGNRLSIIFTQYSVADLDAEFIANIMQHIINYPPKDLIIIKPLMNYIEKYVNPAMDDYIANHPSKDRIDDALKENDAQYIRQLANVESLMLAPKQSQSVRSIVLAMLIFGLLYLGWMFTRGLFGFSDLSIL